MCGSTIRKVHGVPIRKSSERTEWLGSNGVRTLRKRLEVVSRYCNDPTIGSYNNYHLSPNGIPSGNQSWYGLVFKWLVNLRQSLGNG